MASSTLLQPKNKVDVQLTCYHCHEKCEDDRLRLDDKYFCCDGCKMVFEILNTHGLCNYYQLDDNAGVSLKNPKSSKSYAYLDDPEVQEKLLEFSSEHKSQVTFYLPQMHCASCIWLLENLYKLDQGVINARVNFLKKTVTVAFDPAETSLRKIATLLNSIGYAPEINLGDIEGGEAPKINRKLAYQIGLAGFAFGNIMLFSFPDYVGMDQQTYEWFAGIFGYLSIVLAIPVLLYSAKDYFISAWQGLRSRQLNIDIPLCLALGSLFFRSIWEILTHSGPGYLDSFAGLTFLLLTGRWFQQRTWHELSFERDYKSYFPVAATVKSGDEERIVAIQRLVPGDIILVRSQELIPADGILLKGSALVDYSFVTGEAVPVAVKSGDRIFAGGKQIGESIEISLTRRVSQSSLTRLWNDNAFKTHEKGNVTKLADQAGRIFSWIILAVGGGAFLYWGLIEQSFSTGLNAFTAVMIVACPCTVALSIPFTLGNLMRLMGRRRFYLKNMKVVEAFANINTVVFDKTGTITNVAEQQFQFHGKPLGYDEKVAIRSLTRHSSHPLSRRIYDSMPQVPFEKPDQFEEIPGQGIRGMICGLEVKIGSAAFTGGKGQGVFVSIDDQIHGYYEVKSRYRNGLEHVLDFFRNKFKPTPSSKEQVWLLSGDHDQEAVRLKPYFPETSTMKFNQSPQDKLDFINNLQHSGNKVMMIGDGLNDAGALLQSDLGVVIAEDTNNFTPACDAILHADEFSNLPKFVQLARRGVNIVHWSYAVAFTYNLIGLAYAVTGQLSPLVAAVLMPTSSISIVLFGVLLGNYYAKQILGDTERA
ncbi:MAG: heavy metal translocating P-type ATPase metal-binding domain-containing protein [Saprospiraceae bacterium]|nr:heavy metal translocating P-type ATPase metal-binding domain-containing protein [Saprospiraceae bacterium]